MQARHEALGASSIPPSAKEKRLLELLEQAPVTRFTAILKCIPGWQFEGQANLRNWRNVLDKIKAQMTSAVEQCPRLVVASAPTVASNVGADVAMASADEPELTEQVYEALRFSAILLENAASKHTYDAIDIVTTLMGARNERVALEATRLVAMLSLPPQQHRLAVDPNAAHADSPASGHAVLRRRLLTVVGGLGTSLSGVEEISWNQHEDERVGNAERAVIFQFSRRREDAASDDTVAVEVDERVITELKMTGASAFDVRSPASVAAGNLCEELIAKYSVPAEHQFALLVRIRALAASMSSTPRKELAMIGRLSALTALFYIYNDTADVVNLVEKNTGLARSVVELIRVEKCDETPLRIRLCAVHVLSALVYDRSDRGGTGGVLGRQSNVLQALGVAKGAPHGVFPSLARFALSELGRLTGGRASRQSSGTAGELPQPSFTGDAETESDMDMSVAVAFVQATTDFLSPQDAQVLRAGLFRDPMLPHFNELCWIEAVLVLLNTVVSMQSSAAVLTESGVVPALLHIASSPSLGALHCSLITLCIQALEMTVNTHAAAAALYRELSGVNIIVDRLHVEVGGVVPGTSITETKVVLITSLLAMVSVSFHSQGVMSAGAASRVIREGSLLSATLSKIFRDIDTFGPAVFAQASVVVSDIVNNYPSCVNQLHSGGIAEAFLKTVTRWNVGDMSSENMLPASSELIMAIPSVLTVLCLTTNHAEKVARSKPLLYLMDLFATPSLVGEGCDYMQGDVASIVGSAVFELMRQIPAFHNAAIQAAVDAMKKITRYAEDVRSDETQDKHAKYRALLRMATHFSEVMEPILSKSDHASAFADQGGVTSLLTMYQLILPSASTFLSILLAAKGGGSSNQALAHQAAGQAVTQTLRAFASQQPLRMLSALMSELSEQVKQRRQRGDGGAQQLEGLFTALPDVDIADVMNGGASGKLNDVSEFLRRLAYVEWLVSQLAWTMQVGQSSLQNRNWFSELQSRSNTATLEKLFAVNRSVQLERAKLVASHRSSTTAASSSANTSTGAEPKPIKGLWKLCLLLLLRFSLVNRNLLVAMCKTFVFIPGIRARGDDSGNLLAHHAPTLSQFISTRLTEDIQFVAAADNTGVDPFVKKYFLVFVLETIMQATFDAKKKQSNALLLSKLFKTSGSGPSVIRTLFSSLLEDYGPVDAADGRLQSACFKACANALQHLADVETLRASQVTVSLIANSDLTPADRSDQRFDLRKLIVQVHQLCIDFVLPLWESPRLQQSPVESYAQELLPAVVMLLRYRHDTSAQSDSTSASSGDARWPRDPLLERFGRGVYGDFPGGHGSVSDREDFLQALFGATSGRPSSDQVARSRAFEVDSATVDSLAAMGFPRARVERAIRRVQVNSVELAMEWLLSHPDDDDEDDEGEEENGDGENDEAGSAMTETGEAAASPADRQTEEEKELTSAFATLRSRFEEGCFSILREQAALLQPSSSLSYDLQPFVTSMAQYFALLCARVDDERQTVISRLRDALSVEMVKLDGNDHYVMALAHLLAVVLQLDNRSNGVLTASPSTFIDSIVKFISSSVNSTVVDKDSFAPLLLILDAVESKDSSATPSASPTFEQPAQAFQYKINSELRRDIVRASVKLMGLPSLRRTTAHSLWQMLARLTLDYDTANELFSVGGVEKILSVPPAVIFPGYKELTALVLVHMLESPQVLQQIMEEKIHQSMAKLSERYGPASMMRITPRALMMEVATVAARSETVFMQALQKAVTFKKTETGRVYVLPKSPPTLAGQGATAVTTEAPAQGEQPALGHHEKKSPSHKTPKSHRQHAQTIVNQLVSKIMEVWKTERTLPATRRIVDEKAEDLEQDKGLESTVGTYLYLLVQVVTSFPACAAVITKHVPHGSHEAVDSTHCIITLALRELLPCKALSQFASIRRSLEFTGDTEDGLVGAKQPRDALTARTRERVKNAHKLLVTLGTQASEGPKVIVSKLVKLFQAWPACVSGTSTEQDLSVDDEAALSALHAWSALVMSILWPRGGAPKSFSWDKIVLGGGLSGKYAFVKLLVDALRKIKLSHPFAYATCSMVLRPLTTLTRPFVTHRVKKLLKKRSSTAVEHAEEAMHNAGGPSDVMAVQSSHLGDEDVTMPSPQSAPDHEMHALHDEDDRSEHDSESEHDHDEEEEHGRARSNPEDEYSDEDEEGEDEEEEDDDDEDEDEDDDDDEDDDEDEDEDMEAEEGRIRLRIGRRHQGSERSRHGPGALQSETGEGYDEADEDEFSLQRLLDDESIASEQAGEAQRRVTRSRTNIGRAATVGDLLGLDVGSSSNRHEVQTGVFTFGDDDDDEDDPDMAFRYRDPSNLGLPSSHASSGDIRSVGTALANLFEDDGNGAGSADDFIFETIGAGAVGVLGSGSATTRQFAPETSGTTHPLLQFPSLGADSSTNLGGSGLPDRLPLPRQAPSLFHELNALVRHMNTNIGGPGAARTLLGRDLLRQTGGGRHRPPSRNRLSTVSNLLSEFSLDIPTGHGGLNRRGPRPGNWSALLHRDFPDLGGGRGESRTDASTSLLWGAQSASDARSVATRLEQLANDLVEDEPPAQLASTIGSQRNEPVEPTTSSRESEAVTTEQPGESEIVTAVDAETQGTPAHDATSDSASVIALASTLGESSLRSPQGDVGSESGMVGSPITPATSTSVSTSTSASAAAPPPVPVSLPSTSSGNLMNFTLDLSSFQLAPPQAPPTSTPASSSANVVVEEEMKSADEDEGAVSGLVCPEGVDPEVFAFLPPDMQAEIIAQHAPPASAAPASTAASTGSAAATEDMSQLEIDMANSSFDRETLEALPPDIRAEVLANERREREAAARAAAAPEADISRAEEMDNASFVASLAPGLREEILTTCDDAFLQTLPSQVQAEAMVLRERAAYRPHFHESETDRRVRRGGAPEDEAAGDIFRRPTLRRMLMSHGADVFSASARRSGRTRQEAGSRRSRDEQSASAKAGMVRVLRDEEETEQDRILEDKSVRALLRLLFLGQSIVQNRVFQRLLVNVCTYPKTRDCVRAQLLRIVSAPLSEPLMIKDSDGDDDFPIKHLYGSQGALRGWATSSQGVPSEVLSRVLAVLAALARHNVRFAVDCLRHHGLRRQRSGKSDECGAEVLIELLGTPAVIRSPVNLDTLLELVELILTPLDRLSKDGTVKKDADEEEKKEDEDDETSTNVEGEWIRVPAVTMDAARMQDVVGVLSLNSCTPSMQGRTIQILKLLKRVPSNRPRIMHALVQQAKQLTSKDKFRSKDASSSGFEASAVLKSAQDELKLLRLLHTLSDVCETTSDFEECCSSIGLDELWNALSESLDEARVSASSGGADAKSAASGTSTAAAGDEDQGEGMVVEGKSAGASVAMAALLARFLPMVEAFFVVSARDAASMALSVPHATEREDAVVTALREGGLQSVPQDESKVALKRLTSVSSESGGDSTTIRLADFVEANRVLLNLLVREKPSLLDSSLAALIKLPRCRAYLDFDNKRTYFQSAMKKLRSAALRSQVGNAAVRLSVRRDHIFEDSYYALRMRSGAELRRKLHISFINEEGIDAGGVTREWYVILSREIFNPNYVLFTSAADSPTFQPNPLSYVNKDHLSYFEFVGKVIGKAVADGQLLDAHFTRSFYKHILQLPISYHDMEAIDPEYYRNLHSILDNKIEDLGLELTFSAEQSNFGRMEIVDLIPHGRNIAVTNENKMEYVKLVTHHRMATGIRQQIDAFLKGFHQLVPPEMISIFNENELELLISGMPEIDIDDLKANTDYANYKPTDNVIRWFWNVLYSCTQEERALFLQFVTGTSKVPLEGFKALEGMRGTHKFNIHKAFGNPNALPSAHTCFNQLDLPEYESEDKLRQCLLLAIREGTEGFGFG